MGLFEGVGGGGRGMCSKSTKIRQLPLTPEAVQQGPALVMETLPLPVLLTADW